MKYNDIFDEEKLKEANEAINKLAEAIKEVFNETLGETLKTWEELAKYMPASPKPPTGRERFRGLVEGKNKRNKYKLK